MPKIKLEIGAELDVLNSGELAKGLGESQASWFRELARGLKVIRFPQPLRAVPSGGVISIGGDAADANQLGPREGFVWMVQRISVFGDQTTDTVQLFRGSEFITRIPLTTGSFSPGSHALLLHPGELLKVTGTGLTSASITVAGEAIEAPGPMLWKLL